MSNAFDADFLVIPRGLTSLPVAENQSLCYPTVCLSIIPKAVDSFTTATSNLINALKESH